MTQLTLWPVLEQLTLDLGPQVPNSAPQMKTENRNRTSPPPPPKGPRMPTTVQTITRWVASWRARLRLLRRPT